MALTNHRPTPARSGARRPTSSRTGEPRSEVDVAKLADIAEHSTGSHAGLIGFVLGVAIAVAVALLIVQNTQTQLLHWLFFEQEGPIWVIVLGSFVGGLIAGPLLIGGFRHVRQARQDRLEYIANARSKR